MKFKTLMGRALVASIACALAALFLVAVPAEADTAPTLRVSSDPDRTAARDLNGASLSGDAYVFLSGTNLSSVTFSLDPSSAGSFTPAGERWAPYDLAHTAKDGTANPFDTSDLSEGSHVVSAKVVTTGGDQTTVQASFTVSNGSPPPPTTVQTTGSTIIDADFDGQAAGQVTPASFNKLLGDTNDNDASYDSMSYVDDTRGGKAVRTKLAANKYLGSGNPGDGTVLVVKLNRTTDSACMSYDVRFSSGFDFSAGGKIPGLLGVAPGTAPSTPTGGGSVDHGWSGRLMWLGPTSYSFAGEGGNDNMAVTVLYHPGESTKWGDNVQWHKPFIDGKWHHVQQCYTMNTIGKSNGVLKAWFDGTQVVDRSDVLFRTDPNVHITHFDWSIFRGGSSMLWAGKTDGYVDMDNVTVTG